MTILEYIIGAILLVLAIALIAVIGLQQGKRRGGLGNSIAGTGASESYLSRNKITNKTDTYKKLTMILAIAFVVLVLVLYIVGSVDFSDNDTTSTGATSGTTSSESSVADTSSTTSADESADISAEVSE